MIEQRLMAAGGWDVTLRPETPMRVLRQVNMVTSTTMFGHIIVTPSWMPTTNEETLREAARYVGVFRSQGDMARELSGPGLSMWMGDEDDKGDLRENAVDGSTTFALWLTAFRSSYDIFNGLELGDVEGIAGTIRLKFDHLVTLRTLIDDLCDDAGAEWRINWDGTVDFGTPAYLFPTTDAPVEVLMREGGLPVTAWGDQVDGDDYITGSIVPYADDTNYVADRDPSPPYKRLDGANVVVEQHYVPGQQAATSTKATNQAAKHRARHSDVRVEISPSVDVWDIGAKVTPGDTIYVYEPFNGLVDETTQVAHRGEVIFPTTKRVFATTQPIRQGMGVYFRLPDVSGTVIDLTDHVAFEDGDCTLEVGAPRRSLLPAARRGKAA